ncbi:hypothetical protein D5H75_38275 [Bailinhaonella thermotolerans]|uniref:Uncharacterized protein n=2 Tax=Bailinhaonella thermotolerans TaxID=1070861 RepID=A0A3A4A7T4_9ACTN|nr:hypothetical protein D5H75_38275 [Bailinhaonella thermotolerans]
MAECARPRCRIEGEPRAAEPPAVLCRVCVARLRRDLDCMGALGNWLAAHVAAGGRRGAREYVSGSQEPGLPVRPEVLSALLPGAPGPVQDPYGDQCGPPSFPGTLASWAQLVAGERQVHPPGSADLRELGSWLAGHLDWSITRPWAGDYAGELDTLRHTAYGIEPWGLHVQPKVGPCPGCDRRSLIRVAGERYIECSELLGGCAALWTEAEYHRRVAALVTTGGGDLQ